MWPSFPRYFYCRSIGAVTPFTTAFIKERRVREYPPSDVISGLLVL
jgi:hypothetical protein